jgi:alpha-glucosidase
LTLSPVPAAIASIHHDGSSRYISAPRPEGLQLGDEVTIRLRMGVHTSVNRALLRICPDGEQMFIEMRPGAVEQACRWWEATLKVEMPVVSYRFLLIVEDDAGAAAGVWWHNAAGTHRHIPTDADDFRLLAGYDGPAWVRDAVFYQIFPDRFADGDPASNVRDGEWEYRGHRAIARRWGEPPATGWQAMLEFYGGDLPGVTQRLDYLAELGVNAIYLNPVFTAFSNHRYDVVDYDHVDPHLGGDAALAALRRATAERGMRFILDIVPNHCGLYHPWFQAAQADPAAATAEFFTFRRHPDEYASWLGVRSLPKLNYRSERLRWAIYAGPEAVFRRWLRPPFSADGWRIDVANMLGRQGGDQMGAEVARGIRQAVKEENPAAYLVGEHWFDATAQLGGDAWDAVMNYAGFTHPLWHWLRGFAVGQHSEPRHIAAAGRWPTAALTDTWTAYRAAIPWAIAQQQLNLLGSHDTQRILSLVCGDPALNQLAACVLLTYPGVPSIYYGDEIGLAGAGDTAARACMSWERATWNADVSALYRRLIALRRASPALIAGGFQALLVEEDTLAYLRDAATEQVIVAAHRGPALRPAGPLPVAPGGLPDGAEFVELFSGQRSVVQAGHLPLPALTPGATIWRYRPA